MVFISQITLVSAIFKNLASQGVESMTPRQMNAVIKHVDAIIEEFEKEDVRSTPGCGLPAWLKSDDVGMSSKYLASVLSGEFEAEYAHPLDVADFNRCVLLLKAAPNLKDRMRFIRDKSDIWNQFVDSWSELEAHLESGNLEAASLSIKTILRRNVQPVNPRRKKGSD